MTGAPRRHKAAGGQEVAEKGGKHIHGHGITDHSVPLPSASIAYARDRARRYIDEARAARPPPPTPARTVLDTMAEFVISRPM